MTGPSPAPVVSCIVPAFNAAHFLGEALDSIYAQTYRAIEVIVVDDGSTDATAEIAARYGDRLILIRQENAGPGAARNTGFRRARGEFIACLDADDHWHPNKLKAQLTHLTSRPWLAGCFVQAVNFWIDELRQEQEALAEKPITQPQGCYGFGGLLMRRSTLESVGPIRPELISHEDVDWILRAQAAGHKFGDLDVVLYFRRIHKNNLSRSQTLAQKLALVDVIRAHRDRMGKH